MKEFLVQYAIAAALLWHRWNVLAGVPDPVPGSPEGKSVARDFMRLFWGTVITFVCVLTAFFLIVPRYTTVGRGEFGRFILPLSIAFHAALCFFIVQRIPSRTFMRLFGFFPFFAPILTFFAVTVSYLFINGAFDRGEAAEVVADVIRVDRMSDPDSSKDSYMVAVRMSPDDEEDRFQISEDEKDNVEAGLKKVRLKIRPGALGQKWIVSKSFERGA